MRRRILALDLAMHTGWAMSDLPDKPVWGCWKLAPPRQTDMALIALDSWIEVTLFEGVTEVWIEAPMPYVRRKSSAFLQSLAGIARLRVLKQGLLCMPFREVHAVTARKTVIGRGNASKPEVRDWCASQGWNVTDHNAADALVVLRYAEMQDV